MSQLQLQVVIVVAFGDRPGASNHHHRRSDEFGRSSTAIRGNQHGHVDACQVGTDLV